MINACNEGVTSNDRSTATDPYLRLGFVMNIAGAVTGGGNNERGPGRQDTA
jgi:hypothetical protein